MEKNYYDLLVRIQEGLLGIITPKMRAISVKAEEDFFFANVYLEEDATSLDKELIQDFVDHVCINISWLSVTKAETKFIVTQESFDDIVDDLGLWVFVRFEEKVL